MKQMNRLLSLLLALLLLALPMGGMAADKLTPIEELGAALVEAQSAVTDANNALAEGNETIADLEAKLARDERNTKLQDKLIDAMIAQEEAMDDYAGAFASLLLLQEMQSDMAKEADCEDWIVEYDGKYADLLVTATIDENMVLYRLAVEVDGSERDQLVASNDYLYGFIGKDLPLTIGDGKKDDVKPLKDAQQTSKDLVSALNSLVYSEWTTEEKQSAKPQGPITEPQDIADYIFAHGELPDNFITKKEAQALGWDSSYNYVSDVAPGKSIGGDRFGNYEGLLPSKKGRTWYEADCYYTKGKRNAHRILFSNDGLVYYTDDHYESFTQMFPSK